MSPVVTPCRAAGTADGRAKEGSRGVGRVGVAEGWGKHQRSRQSGRGDR